MPRYYFDTDDGQKASRDDDGLECADLDTAQEEAAKELSDIARDLLRAATRDVLANDGRRAFTITIRDESGKAVYRFTVSLLGERL